MDLKDSVYSASLLEDGFVQVGSKKTKIKLKENENLLGFSSGWILAATIDGVLSAYNIDDDIQSSYNFKKTIASASVQDDYLAVLFASNEMAIYSISNKSLILKEQGDKAIVVNSKIVPPFFKDDLVIFPTLDGKMVIVNLQSKKKLRTTIIDSEKFFSNIIFFKLVDGKIVVATANKMLSLSTKEQRASYDIRSVIEQDNVIYVATKQGEILALNSDLNINSKLKFPFAHILGLIATKDKIFALEKNGYLIEAEKDLSSYKVYSADVDKDGYLYIYDKKFYIGNELISVE